MLNFFQKFREVISHPTHSRTMMILIGLVLLAGVSLTIVVSQQKQTIRQRAADLCVEVTTPCPEGVSKDSDCPDSAKGTQCRLGNDIVECK